MAGMNCLHVHTRWLIRRDMPEVMAIEFDGFEYPWTEREFLVTLKNRNCIGMVAESCERVVGFMIYELHRPRLHLISLAVAGDVRRRGVGRQLIEKLQAKLPRGDRQRITTEVRETNLAAQLFFRELGFKATDILENRYSDSAEAAYYMQYRALVPVGM